ncbi:MAG: hypothetical protein EOO81_05065 [Oxalobacteraceae bacterium]|nr:MAG: hypothetical protein EOO81_05065 [Oxalobacteraceae bacterium]
MLVALAVFSVLLASIFVPIKLAGDLSSGLVWAGQVQGLIHDVPTCAELLTKMVVDAENVLRSRLSGLLAT